MNKKLLIVAVISVIVVLGLFIGTRSCEKKLTPEDQVRQTISKMEEAAEESDRKAFLKYISKNYKDEKHRSYDDIRQLVSIYFFQYGSISAVIKDLEIEMDGDSADVFVSAILSAGDKVKSVKDLLPDQIDVYDFDVIMKKEDGRNWRIVSASWSNDF